MTSLNFIAGIIIIVFAGAIIGINLYKNRDKVTDIDSFVDTYGDDIITALQNAIKILKINMDQFDSRENYEYAIVNTTLNNLKESAINFGIDQKLVNLIDVDALSEIITSCFNDNKCRCFTVLDNTTIDKYKDIIDPIVSCYNTSSNNKDN